MTSPTRQAIQNRPISTVVSILVNGYYYHQENVVVISIYLNYRPIVIKYSIEFSQTYYRPKQH